MKAKIIKWIARLFGISLEPPFEIVDNLDIFVREKLNSMLDGTESLDIATGYFQISGWKAFAESVEKLLKRGGKVRLLIGDVSREYLLPQSARFLLHLIKNPQIEARTVKPRLLHAKLFMARTKEKLNLLFGSSNVTFGGMEANIELNTYEVLDLESKKAKSFIEWFENLWNSAVPIDKELEVEITIASQKEAPPEIAIEDPNKALFMSLLARDLARVNLRDIGNFAPLKFQYIDAVSGINRFFFQPGGKRGLMLAHEVGLGKTIMSGMIIKHLLYHRHIKNILIIAPLSIIRQWMEDLRNKFSMEPVEITSRKIKGFVPEEFNIYLISYDLLREHVEDFPKSWNFVIVDESHFIRNSQTSRFKAVKKLNSKFFLLLTATPMHNKVEDIVTQLFLFVPEEILSKATKREISKVDRTKLFRTFIKRRLQKQELKDIIPERNVLPPEIISLSSGELKIYKRLQEFLSEKSKYYQIISRSIEHIAPFVKQRYLEEFTSSKLAIIFALDNLKERINEAIEKGYIEYNFGMLKKETEGLIADEIHSFVEDELEAKGNIEIRRDEDGNLIISLSIDEKIKEDLRKDMEFLNEIANEIEEIDEFSKVKKVIELIKRLKPSKDKKIIVFVGFIKTGEKLLEILSNEEIKAGFFYGELEEPKRKKLIEKLWSEDENRVDVLVSTDAAYVGLNLQIADTIIHHDFSWNPMVVEQRIGRIHRIGQKREITSHSFLCKGTIDERKHEILTKKLGEISTHLGMSYSVVLSEVAISSEIERLMAQFELREIDEERLKEGLRKHITERKEIFELLEELPGEEREILQIGFTTNLIEKTEEIIEELLKIGRRVDDFKIEPIIEDQDFMVLEYKSDGKKTKELLTLKEKAILSIDKEKIVKWKNLYKFENFDPKYLCFFHSLIERIIDKVVEQNSDKFWKKKVSDRKQIVSFYLLIPIKIENPTAGISTILEILVPVIYEVDSDEIKIDSNKVYELVHTPGKIEKLDDDGKRILESAQELLNKNIDKIKDRIRADIEKVRIEIEEIALEKQRAEIEKKITEINRKRENLLREINRKRSSGMKWDREKKEYDELTKKVNELQQKLRETPEGTLTIEFGEGRLVGGCLYAS